MAGRIAGVTWEAPRQQPTASAYADVRQIHPNWIAVVPYAFMRPGSAQVIYDHPKQWWGEGLEGAAAQVEAARALGYQVLLKPQVWMGWNHYTGDSRFDSDADWLQFEESYIAYLLAFARSEVTRGVEALCIGTEFDAKVLERPAMWRRIIAKCREHFPGKLTYATNWDTLEVPFWSDLDAVGVNAYFPINHHEPAASWAKYKDQLASIARRTGKPVIFTEYGYRSVTGTLDRPWAGGDNRASDLQAQYDALKLLYENIWHEPWFHGGFLWKWHLEGAPGIQSAQIDDRYTVQNKPALKLVAEFYQTMQEN